MIYTDTSGNDKGAIRSFDLDLAFGADEQSFELSCAGVEFTGGEYVYIDGTEYGGIVDQYTQSTNSDITTYTGRTWHGILAGKVLVPASGNDYYTLSGDANTCIGSLLTKVGLSSVFTARSTAAGFNVNYQFDRFANAYEGLLKMCASVGAVLMIQHHDGMTEIWAEQASTIENEADSDLMAFTVTKAHRVVNHLVCAGEGELQDRVIVDLYADSSGNVSTTQSLTGVDEVALYYNYSGADSTELTSSGTQKLKEYQTNGGASVDAVGKGDWHVGNKLQVRDNRTGVVVTAVIAKKIVKVSRGVLTVDYEVGDHIAAEAANFDANLSGIAEQPKALSQKQAGEYCKILQGYTALANTSPTDLNGYTTIGTYSFNSTIAGNFTNAPFTNSAGILEVGKGYNGTGYLYQMMTTYTRSIVWWRYSTDGGSSWSTWLREAPKSSTGATANRFLASPDGVAGLPSYRAIALGDLPTNYASETTIANVITQTQTQTDSYPVTAANYYQWGKIAMLRLTFKPAAATSTNTNMSICTLNNGMLPVDQAYGGSTYIMAACTAAGAISGRPRTSLSANTSYAMSFTYILA